MNSSLNGNQSIGILGALALLTVGCAPDGDVLSPASETAAPAQGGLSSFQGADDAAELAALARSRCPRDLPVALNPPVDATVVSVLAARGVQIYTCAAAAVPGTAPAWTLKAPHAVLAKGFEVGAIHFAGPSWQSTDGSLVTGLKVASAPSPDTTAIPWLLLSAASNVGPGLFSDVTSIQRLNTEGGVAPATGCDDAHVGAQVLVPYRADYFFYHPAPAGTRVRRCASP